MKINRKTLLSVLIGLGVVGASLLLVGALLPTSYRTLPVYACVSTGLGRMSPGEYSACLREQAAQTLAYWQAQGSHPINAEGTEWHLGTVLLPSGTRFATLYLHAYFDSSPFARAQPVSLRMSMDFIGGRSDWAAAYELVWYPPHPLGELVITDVRGFAATPYGGVEGTVWFESEDGYSGSLDMASGTWMLTPPVQPL